MASLAACAARVLLGCSSEVKATNVTLAEYSQDGVGGLHVWVDDAGLEGLLAPWTSTDSPSYPSALPCPLLHVRTTVNGVDCPTSPGATGPGPSGLTECVAPIFHCAPDLRSGHITVRVSDATKAWTLEGDLPKPTGRIVGGDTVHVGTWASVALNEQPGSAIEIAFLPQGGAPGFSYGLSSTDGGCDGSHVDNPDGGAPLPPSVSCRLIVENGGFSFWVPDTPGTGTLIVSGYPVTEITRCDGPRDCLITVGYDAPNPTALVPIDIVP